MSTPAAVLLLNVRLLAEGKLYRKGTKKRAHVEAQTRELAGLLIANGC